VLSSSKVSDGVNNTCRLLCTVYYSVACSVIESVSILMVCKCLLLSLLNILHIVQVGCHFLSFCNKNTSI